MISTAIAWLLPPSTCPWGGASGKANLGSKGLHSGPSDQLGMTVNFFLVRPWFPLTGLTCKVSVTLVVLIRERRAKALIRDRDGGVGGGWGVGGRFGKSRDHCS